MQATMEKEKAFVLDPEKRYEIINDQPEEKEMPGAVTCPGCQADIEAFGQMICGDADPISLTGWLNSYHERRCALASDFVLRLELGPKPS